MLFTDQQRHHGGQDEVTGGVEETVTKLLIVRIVMIISTDLASAAVGESDKALVYVESIRKLRRRVAPIFTILKATFAGP